eukprot:scaffold98044_cov72-Phaeocystis_antarctica.AAC.6
MGCERLRTRLPGCDQHRLGVPLGVRAGVTTPSKVQCVHLRPCSATREHGLQEGLSVCRSRSSSRPRVSLSIYPTWWRISKSRALKYGGGGGRRPWGLVGRAVWCRREGARLCRRR